MRQDGWGEGVRMGGAVYPDTILKKTSLLISCVRRPVGEEKEVGHQRVHNYIPRQ